MSLKKISLFQWFRTVPLSLRNSGNVTTKLGSATTTVTHYTNGSRTITIAATFNMNATLGGTYYGTMSTSKSVALDTLDRTAPTVTLRYNSSTNSSINLTATANVSCDIWQYSLDNGSWVSFGSTGTTNTFNISNLNSGTTHSVKVRARKTSNNVYSANSANVSATVKPGNPGSLSVSEITDTSAKLDWGSVSGATSYKTYTNGTLTASGITSNTYTFNSLASNTNYTLGVDAVNAAGSSSLVTKNNVITKPAAPINLVAVRQSCSAVDLAWSAPVGGTAETLQYEIYRDDNLIFTTDN